MVLRYGSSSKLLQVLRDQLNPYHWTGAQLDQKGWNIGHDMKGLGYTSGIYPDSGEPYCMTIKQKVKNK